MDSPRNPVWDARLYDDSHSFVWKFGADLIELLRPRPGERILDLGCGTGHLTEKIAESGAMAIGVDSSPEMVARAAVQYPGIRFAVADARELPFDRELDAIFSNAVLHWIPEADRVAVSLARALKPGGRFVAEFGGAGNIAMLVEALHSALRDEGVSDPSRLNPWYYPTIGEYSSLLERHGFRVRYAAWFERTTPLEGGESGLRTWLQMFAEMFLRAVDSGRREEVVAAIEDRLRSALFFDGAWHVDYKRLRISAELLDGSSESAAKGG